MFNANFRGKMLTKIKEMTPEIYPLMYSAYGSPSPLLFSDQIIWSTSGCQQGDVADPLGFSVQIHDLAEDMESELPVFYLDDGTCCDTKPEKILNDIHKIIMYEDETGLQVNPSKCEVLIKGFTESEREDILSDIDHLLPGIKEIKDNDTELLGAAVFTSGVPPIFKKKLSDFEAFCKRLPHMSSHAAFFLLKNSIGIQRIIYLLRTSLVFLHRNLLAEYDQKLRDTLEEILNLSIDNHAWTQLTLPVASGGIGIRSSDALALPCFLSSYHASEVMFPVVCGSNLLSTYTDLALREWDVMTSESRPEESENHKQFKWDEIYIRRSALSLGTVMNDPISTIRLSAASTKYSGIWLEAYPSNQIGTKLDDTDFRTAVALRLGLELCSEYTCRCGSTIPGNGLHPLSCPSLASGREGRHAAINDVFSRALRQAGISNTQEPLHLSVSDGKRPDGVTHTPWQNGKCMIWDATVRDTYAQGYRRIALLGPGEVAKLGETQKDSRYESLAPRYTIIPVALESSGIWGKRALNAVKRIGSLITLRTGEKKATSYIRQRISIEVQRGNSRMIMESLPRGANLQELFDL
jgi:hypothetical protein